MRILRRPTLLLASVALLSSLSACDDQGYCLPGEGDVETRVLNLSRFSGVEASGSTKVYIKKGAEQRVEVRGQGNILDELETDVENGVWDISFDRCLRKHDPVEVYITVPELDKASIGGSGSVELEDVFESREFETSVSGSGDVQLRLITERIEASISGSGTIRAAGVASQQDVTISGSGNYRASDLSSREAEIGISGSGEAELDVERQLDVEISGSGRVYYTGSASVNSSVSGSGKVIKK